MSDDSLIVRRRAGGAPTWPKLGAAERRLGIRAGEQTSNWYVGYVEKGRTVHYFALQIGATDFGRAYSERIPLARRILTELGILN